MTKRAHIESQRLLPVGVAGIEKIRAITKSAAAVKVNEMFVDVFSAGAIISIYDQVNPAIQEKLRSFPIGKVADLSYKILNRVGGAA